MLAKIFKRYCSGMEWRKFSGYKKRYKKLVFRQVWGKEKKYYCLLEENNKFIFHDTFERCSWVMSCLSSLSNARTGMIKRQTSPDFLYPINFNVCKTKESNLIFVLPETARFSNFSCHTSREIIVQGVNQLTERSLASLLHKTNKDKWQFDYEA